jgi:Zn-dependent metalloprotease
MKKIIFSLFAGLILTGNAQQNKSYLQYADQVINDNNQQAIYVSFKEQHRVNTQDVQGYINSAILGSSDYYCYLIKEERDLLGFIHQRYGIKVNDVIVNDKIIVAHIRDGKLISLNGDLSLETKARPVFVLTEKLALQKALNKVNARKYKWENKEEEAHMRMALNMPDFSYQPKGEKVLMETNGVFYSAYKFNIYAEEPLYRANVLVDAQSGKIIDEQNLICTADVPGTALTKYSGTQTLTIDQQNPSLFRLREVQRGQGVDTYNMKNTTTYSATDFTNTATSWTNTGVDQAATDAHWGAEVTYDYFMNVHNRNSIDGNGFKLLSYVHYSTNYNNAFWDGQRMTYGDGNGTTFTILTGLDVCGHEVTHGLTSNSSQLVYQNESGALNESYSDIFGTTIENYGRPANWNWKIGTDITPSGNGIRDMQNPKLFNHPNCYLGQYYYTGTNDNGGVHTNSGVSNYWFYLLTAGGTGTNDISNPYTVNGIGMASAARIAFRALTVYYTPSTNFANARALSIQAAKDLYGACSNEVIQTTNAWHAVGVGPVYSPSAINPDFTASNTNICSLPATINFNNTTSNGTVYAWDFGDNSVSTTTNPVHTYTANGVYSVKLKATGCTSAQDSIIKSAYITINAPAAPSASGNVVCNGGSMVLNASANGNIKWYSNPSLSALVGSGNSFTTPVLNSNTTYYAVNTVSNAPAFGGIVSSTSGGGYLTNATHYLVFDVSQACELVSVEMNAQTAGSRTVELRSSTNAVITSTVVNLIAGSNTVSLNFQLNVGTNYRLGLSGTTALFRTNTGVSYPYNVGGCVNLINSSAGTGFYYWFYNWQVKKSDCVSPAVAVTASVNPSPAVSISLSNSVVCKEEGVINLTATPAGGTFSGTGVNGSTFDPAVGTGTYLVSYNYTDGNGCSNSATMVLNVAECTGLQQTNVLAYLTVFPNPTKDVLQITGITGNGFHYSLTDAAGRIILKDVCKSSAEKISLSNLVNGIYFLNINWPDGAFKVYKVVKE